MSNQMTLSQKTYREKVSEAARLSSQCPAPKLSDRTDSQKMDVVWKRRRQNKQQIAPVDATKSSENESDDAPESGSTSRATSRGLGWRKSDTFNHPMNTGSPTLLSNSHPEHIAMMPLDLFDNIFTHEMFAHLMEQFEQYVARDMNTGFSTSIDEIHKFVSILLVSGIQATIICQWSGITAAQLAIWGVKL